MFDLFGDGSRCFRALEQGFVGVAVQSFAAVWRKELRRFWCGFHLGLIEGVQRVGDGISFRIADGRITRCASRPVRD